MDSLDLEGALRRSRITAPQAPLMQGMLAPGSGQAAGAGVGSQPRRRGTGALLLRVGLAMLVITALLVGLQVRFDNVARRSWSVSPFNTVNAAYASAGGFSLDFTIYDKDFPRPKNGEWKGPNIKRFEKEAEDWARSNGLDRSSFEPAMGVELPVFQLMWTGGGRSEGQYLSKRFQVSLRIEERGAVEDFCSRMAQLPGVSDPEIRKLALYAGKDGVSFVGIGGFTPEQEAAKVFINGISHEYPEDFEAFEAQDLYWSFEVLKEGGIDYWAFRDKRDWLRDRSTRTSRFDLGDVFRVALDKQGNMHIDTVLENWELPAATLKAPVNLRLMEGWCLRLPAGFDESTIDPVEELSRKFDPLPGDSDPRYYEGLHYWLVPLERLIGSGAGTWARADKAEARRIADEMQAVIDAWTDAHPEVQRSLVFGDRIDSGPWLAGPNVIAFTVGLHSEDLHEFDELKAQLAAIPGVPQPQSNTTDLVKR
ncbi:hypothetical protein IT575_03140 [bacterium]|nr:hypothetical protein [bacterium]